MGLGGEGLFIFYFILQKIWAEPGNPSQYNSIFNSTNHIGCIKSPVPLFLALKQVCNDVKNLLYSCARQTGFRFSRFVWVRFTCSLRLMPSASLALTPRISPNAFWGMVAPSPSVSSGSAGSCLRTSVKNSGPGPWPPPCLGWPLPLSSGFHILLFQI